MEDYAISGRRKFADFKNKPWFKTALKLKATVMAPFPFPLVMKAAEKVWRKKHPSDGAPVSGIFDGIDLKSAAIGAGITIALVSFLKGK